MTLETLQKEMMTALKEKDKLKKRKTRIVVLGALTMAAAGASKIIKASKNHNKK